MIDLFFARNHVGVVLTVIAVKLMDLYLERLRG